MTIEVCAHNSDRKGSKVENNVKIIDYLLILAVNEANDYLLYTFQNKMIDFLLVYVDFHFPCLCHLKI